MSESVAPANLPTDPSNTNLYVSDIIVIVAKIITGILFVYPFITFSFNTGQNKNETELKPNIEPTPSLVQQEIIENNKTKEVKTRIIFPPSCPTFHQLIILQELCQDYTFKSICCCPEDYNNLEKHQITENVDATTVPVTDPRSTIVGFLTSGLLIASLIAAFLELYKAKKQAPSKTKAPLTRKCSLADLTIMKHHRKELLRRDSILEVREETKQPVIYKKAPPLQRSSSTPAESISEVSPFIKMNRSFDSRRNSVVDNQQFTNYTTESSSIPRQGIDSRRGSIFETRKVSIIDGKFVDRYDSNGRRVSIDITSSPERKHHSRLVHRH